MTLHTLILLLLLLPHCEPQPELPPVPPEQAEFGTEYRIIIDKPE